MPITSFSVIPTSIAEWSRFFRAAFVKPSHDSVGVSELQDGVVTTEKVAGATAAADGSFYVKRAGAMVLGTIQDTDLPSTITRDVEYLAGDTTVAANAASALAEHVAASDPHPVYLTQTEGDARYPLLSNILSASTTFDPPSIASGAVTTTTVTVTGAAVGDFALASHGDSSTANVDKVELNAKVTAADTVTVYFRNNHTAGVDPASATLKVRVWK